MSFLHYLKRVYVSDITTVKARAHTLTLGSYICSQVLGRNQNKRLS